MWGARPSITNPENPHILVKKGGSPMTDVRYDNCCHSKCRCKPTLPPGPPCPQPPYPRTFCSEPPCASPPEDRDIRIDFYPAPCKNPVAWGTVYDDCKQPLSGVLVELLQCNDENNSCCLVIGQTYSDCNGHYEIPIPYSCQGKYRIEVSNPGACQAPLQPDLPRRGQNNICYY